MIKNVDAIARAEALRRLEDYDRLREVNAELLAALKAVCNDGPKNPPPPIASEMYHRRWANVQAARAAIARAEGEDR